MIKVTVLVTFYNGEISPFEQSALECALEMENAQVSVVSMSPMAEKERLEYLTRLGVDAVLISDKSYAGSDTLVTSKILAKYFTLNKYDLIMCGKQSLKGDTAQVPGQLSANLGYKFIPYVMGFNNKKLKTRLGEIDLELPCIVSVERIKTLRFPSIFSKKKEKKTPLCASAILTVLLIVLLSIPLIGCVGFSNLFFESVAYENDMKNGKAQILVGEVELLSYQEVYTRGNGLHYVVELRIGEQIISPLNGFNKEHLEYFQSGEKMSIEYGIIQGEGLYIWSIKVLQNNE